MNSRLTFLSSGIAYLSLSLLTENNSERRARILCSFERDERSCGSPAIDVRDDPIFERTGSPVGDMRHNCSMSVDMTSSDISCCIAVALLCLVYLWSVCCRSRGTVYATRVHLHMWRPCATTITKRAKTETRSGLASVTLWF